MLNTCLHFGVDICHFWMCSSFLRFKHSPSVFVKKNKTGSSGTSTVSPLFIPCEQHCSKTFILCFFEENAQSSLHFQTNCERRILYGLMQVLTLRWDAHPSLYMMCACEKGACSQNRASFVCMSRGLPQRTHWGSSLTQPGDCITHNISELLKRENR